MGAKRPPVVIKPHFTNSRRETLPVEKAFRISARFFRAFSASLILALEDFSDKKNPSFLSVVIRWRSKSGNPAKRFPRNLRRALPGEGLEPATGSLVVNVKGGCTHKGIQQSK
jgi:hypothetical protein